MTVKSRRLKAFTAAGAVLLSACGLTTTVDINGMTGVTVDAGGRPVLVAELCDGVVSGVTVTGPNRGAVPNEIRADLTAAQPVDHPFTLDLISPPGDWTGTALGFPLGPDLYIAAAHGGADADSQLTQVSFTAAELAELRPGTVQYVDHEPGQSAQRTDLASFPGVACDE